MVTGGERAVVLDTSPTTSDTMRCRRLLNDEMTCPQLSLFVNFIKNYRTTLENVINFSPESQPKLVSQYKCVASREVTLPWRLVHRRRTSYFQNYNFN